MKKLTKKYANIEAMKSDGWTDDDLVALKNAPRSRAAEFDEEHTYFRWPFIDGISIVGLYSLLTEDEKKGYREYKKKHMPTGLGTVKAVPEEIKAKWDELEEICKSAKAEKALALIAELRPKSKSSLLKQLLDVDNVGELKTKCTLAYVMYRGPNGEFFKDKPSDKVTLKDFILKWEDSFECAFTKQQVTDAVAKLKSKGIILDAVII